ncbi:MAG: fluoride efflux transporter CrcB [Actinomycetota bacterium]|jgi:CrcB protein
MTVWVFAMVAVAGGLGSALRAAVDAAVHQAAVHQAAQRTERRSAQQYLRRTGRSAAQSPRSIALPLGTAVVNVSGSFLLGVVTGSAVAGVLPTEWQAVVATGLLGGYTTFSTASLETVRLVQAGRFGAGLLIGFGVLVLSVAAAWAGLAIAAVTIGAAAAT